MLAYNDAAGVAAPFDLNRLGRINRALKAACDGADCGLDAGAGVVRS